MKGFLNPKDVLSNLELKENLIAADFGCGSGGWVIPLAQKLEKGRVFAIDILKDPLSSLESSCKEKNISNVKTIISDVEEDSTLKENSVNLVLLTNLLFQVEDRKKVLKEAKRILKKGGELLIVDWKKDSKMGPEGKISSSEVKEIAEEDFEFKKEINAGDYHYALLFKK
jgi:ubiquinone/menaquinone biosynthesis C-methylase UbiE